MHSCGGGSLLLPALVRFELLITQPVRRCSNRAIRCRSTTCSTSSTSSRTDTRCTSARGPGSSPSSAPPVRRRIPTRIRTRINGHERPVTDTAEQTVSSSCLLFSCFDCYLPPLLAAKAFLLGLSPALLSAVALPSSAGFQTPRGRSVCDHMLMTINPYFDESDQARGKPTIICAPRSSFYPFCCLRPVGAAPQAVASLSCRLRCPLPRGASACAATALRPHAALRPQRPAGGTCLLASPTHSHPSLPSVPAIRIRLRWRTTCPTW